MIESTNTLLYEALFRTFRNSVVSHTQSAFVSKYGPDAGPMFKRWLTDWEHRENQEAASALKAGVDPPSGDNVFELLDATDAARVLIAHLDLLVPAYAQVAKKEKARVKEAIDASGRILNGFRNLAGHTVTQDVSIEACLRGLQAAKLILKVIGDHRAVGVLEQHRQRLLEDDAKPSSFKRLPRSGEVVSDFVGRDVELEELRDWLTTEDDPCRMLGGDGGKGKSSIAYALAVDAARRLGSRFEAVIWMSAKKRKFSSGGSTVEINSPDFASSKEIIEIILQTYSPILDLIEADASADPRGACLEVLQKFPALIIADDIDSLEGKEQEAIRFLNSSLASLTGCKVLFTSRRVTMGFEDVGVPVKGLPIEDVTPFLRSRCRKAGINPDPVLQSQDRIREVCDGSPLYMQDLLRLLRSGMPVAEGIGLWQDKRGQAAREYAVRREFESLESADAREILVALSSVDSAVSFDTLMATMNWHEDRMEDATRALNEMFLMPDITHKASSSYFTINNNTRELVRTIYGRSGDFDRRRREILAAQGKSPASRPELLYVKKCLGLLRARVEKNEMTRSDAISELIELRKEHAGIASIWSTMGWVYKKDEQVTAARDCFSKAVDLQCKDSDVYFHWAELENDDDRWTEAIRVVDRAITGVNVKNATLLVQRGYAHSRLARKAFEDAGEIDTTCRNHAGKSHRDLHEAISMFDQYAKSLTVSRAYRGLTLTSSTLGEGAKVARHLKDWRERQPSNETMAFEWQQARLRFPEYVLPFN